MFHDLFSLSVLLGGSFLTFIVVALYRKAQRTKRIRQLGTEAKQIPYWLPFGIDLIFRDVRSVLGNTSIDLFKRTIEYGQGSHTVQVEVLGKRFIFTDEPANVQAILASQFQDYGKGEPFHAEWYDFLGDSIFTTDLKEWHASRVLLRPLFLKNRLTDFNIFETHTEKLISLLPSTDATVDLADLFMRLTMDIATDFLFGRSTESLQNPRNKFVDAFADVQKMQNIFVRAGPANKLIPRFKFRRDLKVLDEFIEPYITEALTIASADGETKSKDNPNYSFLHGIAAETGDRKILRDQILAMLLAGRDTTASALSWLFYELAQHPEVLQHLRKEILDKVGREKKPTSEDLKEMKYLTNCIKESLRLYPSVPFNMRLALHDTTLPTGGGPSGTSPIGILKDTGIAYSAFVLQRRPDFYPPGSPNPDSFVPERWESWQPSHWQYIPFNAGPRVCMGQEFAMVEMQYSVVRILQKVRDLELRMKREEQVFVTNIIINPGKGVPVGVRWDDGA